VGDRGAEQRENPRFPARSHHLVILAAHAWTEAPGRRGEFESEFKMVKLGCVKDY